MIAAGKEMEEEMWAKVAELDKEKEALCNEEGITTVKPSQEFLNELSTVTENIRQEWLQDAPPEAQEIVTKFKQEVGRE